MSIETVVFLLLFAFIAGGVVGAILSQRVGPSSTQRKQLEAQLKQARQELSDYQTEVTDTFAETAKRVNKLTASYKDVHDHLAQSAIKLTSAAVGQQFLETGSSENQEEHETPAENSEDAPEVATGDHSEESTITSADSTASEENGEPEEQDLADDDTTKTPKHETEKA